MKTKRFIALSGALAAILALPLSGAAEASEFFAAQSQSGAAYADLTIDVKGLDNAKGDILIGLYNSEDGFKSEDEMRGQAVPVNAKTVKVTFDNLPVGRYAVKVFHDIDKDGKLDTDLFGIPSEPYGFSRDASDPFSAPEWAEARFILPAGRMTQTINLD